MTTIHLSGTTVDWIRDNTSWGQVSDGGPPQDRSARLKILDAPSRKCGKGARYKVDLTTEELDTLWSILDSIAGAWESMSAGERDGAWEYRALRKDANRLVGL